jgi:phosphopentomutase
VLQIAAHTDAVAVEELHAACAAVRELMTGEHAVGRVIARPVAGHPGAFERVSGRRDFALPPPTPSYLDALRDAGVPVHAVGKVADLFAGEGIDATHPGATNAEAIATTTQLLEELHEGFVFANLIETDQVYGHRKDIEGFHGALREIDAAVERWLALLGDDDLLVLTADHGCDPLHPGTDHTREHAPLLARFVGDAGRRHDGPLADVGASALDWLTGRRVPGLPGTSFIASA